MANESDPGFIDGLRVASMSLPGTAVLQRGSFRSGNVDSTTFSGLSLPRTDVPARLVSSAVRRRVPTCGGRRRGVGDGRGEWFVRGERHDSGKPI